MFNVTIAVAAVSAVLAFGSAWKIQGWRHAASVEDSARAEEERRVERAALQASAATAYAKGRAEAEARNARVEREVARVVSKPEYRDVCLDADGLRVIADDVSTTNARRSIAGAVPASSATD